jgi:hypothetical protein
MKSGIVIVDLVHGFHLRYLRKPRDTQQISLPVLLVLFFKFALFSRCVNIEALNGFFC